MTSRTSRRQFLQVAGATGIGFWIAGGVRAQEGKSANERIRVACIGLGGQGSLDAGRASRLADVVAICDVDQRRLATLHKVRFPKAKQFTDFRRMFDEIGKDVDAVTVSTPDHSHAVAAVMAMRLGKHCYCQKPLTRSIYEARVMGEVARQMKVASQMGNQGTSLSTLRKGAALVKAGALGDVSEVHVWTNRPIWPQGGPRPKTAPCPKGLDWDLWLGPAPERPYAHGYHPFSWRGWWDFGTGALGDMACHNMNLAFMALDLRNPISMQAETSGNNKDSFPNWSVVTYEFAANSSRGPVKMIWYDGGKRPGKEVLDGKEPEPGGGGVIVGQKGKLYWPNSYGERYEFLGGVSEPKVEFIETTGDYEDWHFKEWIEAVRGGPPATANFQDYGSPLTETVLAGNLAVWVNGPKIEWDAENMKVTNVSGLETLVKPEYRPGYTL